VRPLPSRSVEDTGIRQVSLAFLNHRKESVKVATEPVTFIGHPATTHLPDEEPGAHQAAREDLFARTGGGG
jgi:hypothetical protein